MSDDENPWMIKTSGRGPDIPETPSMERGSSGDDGGGGGGSESLPPGTTAASTGRPNDDDIDPTGIPDLEEAPPEVSGLSQAYERLRATLRITGATEEEVENPETEFPPRLDARSPRDVDKYR